MSNVPTADTWTSIVNVFGNVISLNNTYCFNIDLDSPGPKKIVFCICQQAIDTESDTNSDATEIETIDKIGGNGDCGDMKVKDAEIGISEVKVEDDLEAVIGPDFHSNDSDVSTCPSTPILVSNKRGATDMSKASDKRIHKSKKARVCSPVVNKKKTEKTNRSCHKVLTPQEQCIHIAHWIPCGLDMFCNLTQVIQVCLLLERRSSGGRIRRRTHCLQEDFRQVTFKYVMEHHVPYLRDLISKRKKCEELKQLITEVYAEHDKPYML
ncbi:hypothetical protein BDR05DRAFT_948926 [Suillus weaverae]|nr:hypothetical protein BDR05DRAFT_948926 [Suillus weaverae]